VSSELREQRNVDLRFDTEEETRAAIKRCAVELALERLFCADPEHPTVEERKVIATSASKWIDQQARTPH
jgi:hypothetical protein